jgi:hypothetical protein
VPAKLAGGLGVTWKSRFSGNVLATHPEKQDRRGPASSQDFVRRGRIFGRELRRRRHRRDRVNPSPPAATRRQGAAKSRRMRGRLDLDGGRGDGMRRESIGVDRSGIEHTVPATPSHRWLHRIFANPEEAQPTEITESFLGQTRRPLRAFARRQDQMHGSAPAVAPALDLAAELLSKTVDEAAAKPGIGPSRIKPLAVIGDCQTKPFSRPP